MTSWLDPVADALDAARGPVPLLLPRRRRGLERRAAARAARPLRRAWAAGRPRRDPGRSWTPGWRASWERGRGSGLHQHGLAHVNHEREGRKCEFGPARGAAAQRRDIEAGRARLADLLGDRVDPIFTPPWNRCSADTGRLPRGARVPPRSHGRRERRRWTYPGLQELPVSVDWFAHRHGERLSPAELGGRIAAAIGGGAPVGVMFHHAIIDAADLRRTGELLSLLADHERAQPVPMMELVGQPSVQPEPDRSRSRGAGPDPEPTRCPDEPLEPDEPGPDSRRGRAGPAEPLPPCRCRRSRCPTSRPGGSAAQTSRSRTSPTAGGSDSRTNRSPTSRTEDPLPDEPLRKIR